MNGMPIRVYRHMMEMGAYLLIAGLWLVFLAGVGIWAFLRDLGSRSFGNVFFVDGHIAHRKLPECTVLRDMRIGMLGGGDGRQGLLRFGAGWEDRRGRVRPAIWDILSIY